MADLPVPGPQLSDGHAPDDVERAGSTIAAAIPPDVRQVLDELWAAGYAAYVVGGGPRNVLLGVAPAAEWDLATSALPEQTVAALAGAVYENRFGTVAVRRGGHAHEITTFRSDHDYADFRRPHHVEFTESVEADLARRDFTVNALAWGAWPDDDPRLLDLHGGLADLAARLIRAVGDPRRRFEEDALRIVRAIRLAATLGLTIEPATLAALRDTAPLVGHLSGERVAAELARILLADRPSAGLALLADTGALGAFAPELAAQRGLGQNKIAGEDLWDHSLRTVDATPPRLPLRLAALLHDVGKPATAADGHFYRHEIVGAETARDILDRLRLPRSTAEAAVHLVRQHMFRYEPNWSDAAVRRFLAKVTPRAIEDLFALREADNIGSGVAPDGDGLPLLRDRIAQELAAGPLLDRSSLAIDGSDLIAELGLAPGPEIGRILGVVFERVVEDRSLNRRSTLLALAREVAGGAAESGAVGDPRQ